MILHPVGSTRQCGCCLTTDGVNLAGSTGVADRTDGTGSAATFFLPYGLTTDAAKLYVADSNNFTIRKVQ